MPVMLRAKSLVFANGIRKTCLAFSNPSKQMTQTTIPYLQLDNAAITSLAV